MLRFSLFVGISILVYGVSSKPLKTWGKVDADKSQDTMMSAGEDKLPLGLKEVEPPELLDTTELDIDPAMQIWRSLVESRRPPGEQAHAYKQPPEDEDALYHPSHAQLVQAAAALKEAVDSGSAPEKGAGDWREVYGQSEEDPDDLYHGESWHVPVEPEVRLVQADLAVPKEQVRSAPEEDLDDLYHKY